MHPDEGTEKRGEKHFEETLTFADGKVFMTEHGKMGFQSSAYTLTKKGEKETKHGYCLTYPSKARMKGVGKG